MLNIKIDCEQNKCILNISGMLDKDNIKTIYHDIKKLKKKEILFLEINCLELKKIR